MDLPVTVDDAGELNIGFGGNVSAFVADPADASNNVQSIKTAGSQTWEERH